MVVYCVRSTIQRAAISFLSFSLSLSLSIYIYVISIYGRQAHWVSKNQKKQENPRIPLTQLATTTCTDLL